MSTEATRLVDPSSSSSSKELLPAWMNDKKYSATCHKAAMFSSMVGFFLALHALIGGVKDHMTSMSAATLLVVGGVGILSFVRHSIFFRSDEARIGWKAEDPSFINFFLIEAGMANNAWGVLGVLSVVCNWGLAVQAASWLIYAMYMLQVWVMLLILHITNHPGGRGVKSLSQAASFVSMLLIVAIWMMIEANKE